MSYSSFSLQFDLITVTDCSASSGDNVFPVEESTGLMAMGDTHYLDTWRALEKVVKTGKAKAIGLSNFTRDQIQNIVDKCDVVSVPVVDTQSMMLTSARSQRYIK